MTAVPPLAAFERTTTEARATDALDPAGEPDAPLRIVRARAAARAEIDVFLAVNEVSSFAPAKCAALVRAWGALVSMEAVVSGNAKGASERVPKALAEVPETFVASVFACAQNDAWGDAAAPSERQLDAQGRLLLRAFAGLDRQAKRTAPALRFPWRALRRASLVVLVLAVAAAAVCFAVYRPRWRVAYYANETLSGEPSTVKRTPDADNYWNLGGPGMSMPIDHFSARFESCIVTNRPLSIRFTVGSDDGSRLFVDGKEVIDAWRAQDYTENSESVALDAGAHALRLEYFEREGHARLTFTGRVDGSGADVAPMLRLPKGEGPDACRWSR